MRSTRVRCSSQSSRTILIGELYPAASRPACPGLNSGHNRPNIVAIGVMKHRAYGYLDSERDSGRLIGFDINIALGCPGGARREPTNGVLALVERAVTRRRERHGTLPNGVSDVWHYQETGSGEPLILLHGIGMSHAAWSAVIPCLSATRRTIAFDIAGFGATPTLPRGTPPTIVNLVDGLEQSLRAIGIDGPVDMVGNSLGGTLALEAARRGRATRVVALSPIGLWERHPAPHVPYVFSGLRFLAAHCPSVLKAALSNPFSRELALAVPMSLGSWRMPWRDAFRAVDDLAASTAFEETFDNTGKPFWATTITVPVTMVFGRRDWILPAGSRRRDRLPVHTTWIEPERWGHVPMWADPAGVSKLILEGVRSSVS